MFTATFLVLGGAGVYLALIVGNKKLKSYYSVKYVGKEILVTFFHCFVSHLSDLLSAKDGHI